jgi:hypothetical protein
VSADYYLGDTVTVAVQEPAYTLSSAYRLNQISVEFDEQLVEISNTLQFEVV